MELNKIGLFQTKFSDFEKKTELALVALKLFNKCDNIKLWSVEAT